QIEIPLKVLQAIGRAYLGVVHVPVDAFDKDRLAVEGEPGTRDSHVDEAVMLLPDVDVLEDAVVCQSGGVDHFGRRGEKMGTIRAPETVGWRGKLKRDGRRLPCRDRSFDGEG